MDNPDTQIALLQARLTSAVENGESADSPQVRQMDAQPERIRVLWVTLRQIRLGLETSEGNHVSTSIEAQPDRWDVLQNRPRSTNPDEGTFYALLAALDAGWHIEPPVYVRPRWGSEHAGTVMYHFILRRETGTTMVSVADSPRLREFLDEQRIAVNRN